MASLNNFNVVEKANRGVVVELLDPYTGDVVTDEGEKVADKKNIKNLFIKLLGSDSDVYRNEIKRNFNINQRSKEKKIDLDKATMKGIELLAKCTVDCYLIEDDKVVDCNQSEMIRVYQKYPWIREQAESFLEDRSNLMKG